MKVIHSIYGCIESALLWYNLYASTLKGLGFKINPYDKYVANKMIDGKQCTLVWYVDDNKLSRVDPNVVTNIINIIKEHFGGLVISRGSIHSFWGMNITIRVVNKVEIGMKDQ